MNTVFLMSEQKRARIINHAVFILMLAICGGNYLAPAQTTSTSPRPAVSQESATPENPTGGYGRTLRNLIGLGTRNVIVGVRIEVPLRNRRAQADFASARRAVATRISAGEARADSRGGSKVDGTGGRDCQTAACSSRAARASARNFNSKASVGFMNPDVRPPFCSSNARTA